MKNNKLFGVPSFTRSLDETEECYLDEEGGVNCLHAHVHVKDGRLEEMRFRKKTRMVKLVKK